MTGFMTFPETLDPPPSPSVNLSTGPMILRYPETLNPEPCRRASCFAPATFRRCSTFGDGLVGLGMSQFMSTSGGGGRGRGVRHCQCLTCMAKIPLGLRRRGVGLPQYLATPAFRIGLLRFKGLGFGVTFSTYHGISPLLTIMTGDNLRRRRNWHLLSPDSLCKSCRALFLERAHLRGFEHEVFFPPEGSLQLSNNYTDELPSKGKHDSAVSELAGEFAILFIPIKQ